MTAPYTQQDYADWKARSQRDSADWKARFERGSQVGGLLRQAKQMAGIEDEPEQSPMPPMLQPTPPFNPQAPDPLQRSNQGLLASSLSADPAQGEASPTPPLLQQTSPEDDPNHAHREGLLGRIRHFAGADRISRENSDILEPDQRARLLDMSAFRRYLKGGEDEITDSMVTRRDQKKARDKGARDETMWAQIQGVASKMPPQEGLEYAARMAQSMGLPQGKDMDLAAQRLRPDDPMQVGIGNAVRKPDGTYEIPAPREPARPTVVQVRTANASGKGVIRSVNEETGQVYWEMPAPPETGGLGGPGRPPTEAESKDYVFAGLMRNAMPDIRSTVDKVRPEVITALRADPTGMSKMVLTPDERVFWRGVLEFAAAANRKESGAAITPFEVANTLDRYVDSGFDGPPDSPVRKAKVRARENYLRLLDRTSSRARAFYEGGASPPSAGKPMTPEAYRDAKDNGYTDEEMVAEGYIIPDR